MTANDDPSFNSAATAGPRHNPWKRLVIIAVIAAYVVTWAFGVPAVQTSVDNRTVGWYKHMRAESPKDIRDGHPYMRSYVAFPVLPGVIATYHEYVCANLFGFGGWELHLWYVTGTREIARHPSWVS